MVESYICAYLDLGGKNCKGQEVGNAVGGGPAEYFRRETKVTGQGRAWCALNLWWEGQLM